MLRYNSPVSALKFDRIRLALVVFLAVVAFCFTFPIFRQIHNWGIQDWDQHLFYHAVPRASLLEYGQAPLWNPYYVGGTVMLANPQSRFLSPSFILILLFGEVVGLKLEIWLHLLLGLLGAYALARRYYGLNRAAALMVSFVFMLNSMYFLNLAVGMTWFLSVAYLPWAFLFYLKAFSRRRYILPAGLSLALMFLGGGAYPLSITILFFGLYGLVVAVAKEQGWLKVGQVLGLTLAFMLCLGAVKFFPAIEFLQQHPRYVYDYSGFSLNSLGFSLLSRDQSLEAVARLPLSAVGFVDGVTGAMDENGMYIGFLPLLLFLAGLSFSDRRRLWLLLCFFFFLWLSFGNRPRLELWSWLHLLPVYNSMRIAQRFRIVFMLCLAVLAGFGLQQMQAYLDRLAPGGKPARFLAPLLLAVVLVDLWSVNGGILKEAFTIPPLATTRSQTFYQIWEWPAYDQNGWVAAGKSSAEPDPFKQYNPFGLHSSYGSLYPVFLANLGTINGYETANVPRQAVASTAANYRGEVYLQGTAGAASLSAWSPNRVTAAVKPAGRGWLVLNQNYYTGWHVSGATGQVVENVDGLLAVAVAPGDEQVTFWYRPASFVVGLVVSLATILMTLMMIYRLRSGPKPISAGVTIVEKS